MYIVFGCANCLLGHTIYIHMKFTHVYGCIDCVILRKVYFVSDFGVIFYIT